MYFHPLLHPQLTPCFLLLHLHLVITSYFILHQTYYLRLQIFLYMLQNRYWIAANITSCRTSRDMWVNTSEVSGKDNNEFVSCRYSFLSFFYRTLNFYLVFCIFLGKFLTFCMKTYYTAITEKVLPVSLISLFFWFISYMPTRHSFEWRKLKII